MTKAIGIDLGTTFSVAALVLGSRVKVVRNIEKDRLTPSVVAFTRNESLVVGKAARAQAAANPGRTVSSVKRLMGSGKTVTIGKRCYRPQEISSFILGKIKRDIEESLGEPVSKAVITAPAYFDERQRQATLEAGTLAGFDVLRIISEPTAAAFAYGLHCDDVHHVLVWDLGGGTFDVSILELGDGVFEVKAVNGDTRLGGDDWDQIIIRHLARAIHARCGVDVSGSPEVMQRLMEAAEKAKISLSLSQQAKIRVPFVVDGEEFKTTLSREHFEEMSKELLRKLVRPTTQALADSKLGVDEIDKVVLVGGSTRMPAVRKLARELFGKEPYTNLNPDEVVAIGAGVQAGVLLGEIDGVALVDVTPLSLGIETQGGLFAKLIERNTAIPASAGQIFTTAADRQTQVDVRIFQGERVLTVDNACLGEFVLDEIPPAPKGTPQIEVTFHIDANGVISASALDLHTGMEKTVTLQSTWRMSAEQIRESIENAERFAEDDALHRKRVQCGILAENMIAAAEMMLDEHEDSLAETDLKDVETAIAKVREAMSGGVLVDIETQTRELKRLLRFYADTLKRKRLRCETDAVS